MTQEDKELLLRDLYARVPYGIHAKVKRIMLDEEVEYAGKVGIDIEFSVLQAFPYKDDIDIKPYLRPMSSMTAEEEEEYWNIINSKSPEMPVEEIPSIETIAQCSVIVLDWLLFKGFDIRDLIPKGLALEAPEGMYNLKEK